MLPLTTPGRSSLCSLIVNSSVPFPSFFLQILMNVLRILILVMIMPVVLTPLDPTTARVTLDLKEMDLIALVCIADTLLR